jgi:hypothetical protein
MKLLYTIAALALMSGSAQAFEVYRSCVGNGYYGYASSSFNSNCRTSVIEEPSRDYAREAEAERLRKEQVAKWEAFCKPARNYDKFGVVRLSYSQAGCEFGRYE